MTLCVHEIDAATCYYCSGKEKAEKKAEQTDKAEKLAGGWILANYAGRCPLCGERYAEDTPIHPVLVDGSTRWACC